MPEHDTHNDCFQLLITQSRQLQLPQLLIADENIKHVDWLQLINTPITVVTNRYDIYQKVSAIGINIYFSDFDFSVFPSHHFKQILYRVSKEKSIAHHIINQAQQLLAPKGQLVLTGEKNDGIKTYTDKASTLYGCRAKAKKRGNTYLSVIQKLELIPQTPLLDDHDYSLLRPCIPSGTDILYSKPGLFGWNKIDLGSALLADQMALFFQQLNKEPANVLDLGCGYGYLSIMASQYTRAEILATDNNAAALAACAKNYAQFNINGQVVAGDCADTLDQRFDVVICNPPFHSGFDADTQLIQRFITSCYQHLRPKGQALFVVNRFIALEQSAKRLFETTLVADNKSFRVVRLNKK